MHHRGWRALADSVCPGGSGEQLANHIYHLSIGQYLQYQLVPSVKSHHTSRCKVLFDGLGQAVKIFTWGSAAVVLDCLTVVEVRYV